MSGANLANLVENLVEKLLVSGEQSQLSDEEIVLIVIIYRLFRVSCLMRYFNDSVIDCKITS